MYLSNTELYNIVDSLNFETQDNLYPFSVNDQIRLCSIDIRLSTVFWYQRKLKYGQKIDLKHGKLYDISPSRLWRKKIYGFEDKINLKPGEMIIGQTFEKFTIPKKYAGKIITRSSFTRLGIETSCTNDFINPGYRGRVPLEIINNSKNTIILYPLTPICQIMLIPLSSEPIGSYGDKKFSSKYQNEDGSPSLWWRDNLMERVQIKLSNLDYSTSLIKSLSKYLENADDDCLDRFHKYISNLKGNKIDTSDEIFDRFVKNENLLNNIRKFGIIIFPMLVAFSFGITYQYLTESTIKWKLVTIFSLLTIVMGYVTYKFITDKKVYLTEVK